MSVALMSDSEYSAAPIGTLVWFAFGGPVEYIDGKRTVLPVAVSSEDLYTWFAELGLDQGHLPPQVRRIDKFRAVTSNARHRYEVTNGRAELYVEEIAYDVNQVVRNVMRRVVDDQHRTKIDHVATLKFIRGGRSAKVRRTSNDHWRHAIMSSVREPDRGEIEKFIADIDTAYHQGADTLDTTALRGVVRRYLLASHSVPMRSTGGLYFVPASQGDLVPKLAEVIRRIDSSGCSIDFVDYLDTDHTRTILAQAFQAHVIDDCANLERAIDARRAAAVSRGNKLAPSHYAELRARIDAIITTIEVYVGLGLPLGTAGEALESVSAKLAADLNTLTLRK